MSKYLHVADMLESRVRRGDYVLRELPAEKEFAAEVGVARMTVRRAIQLLIDRGVVVRKPYGKLEVHPELDDTSRLQLALMMPAFPSSQHEKWSRIIETVIYDTPHALRPVSYAHWDDPVIARSLSSFDGVFMITTSEPMPGRTRELLSQSGNVVVLDNDYSAMSVPSLRMMRPEFIHLLGDHLASLGHRRIALLNTQPGSGEATAQWVQWCALHGIEPRTHDLPVQPGHHPTPGAYQAMHRLLSEGAFDATALVCLTGATLMGAARALHEHGLAIGRDIAACTLFNSDGMSRYETPSCTSLFPPPPEPFVKLCIDWFARRGDPWQGPLLLQPTSAELFEGESTTSFQHP